MLLHPLLYFIFIKFRHTCRTRLCSGDAWRWMNTPPWVCTDANKGSSDQGSCWAGPSPGHSYVLVCSAYLPGAEYRQGYSRYGNQLSLELRWECKLCLGKTTLRYIFKFNKTSPGNVFFFALLLLLGCDDLLNIVEHISIWNEFMCKKSTNEKEKRETPLLSHIIHFHKTVSLTHAHTITINTWMHRHT